MACLKLPFGVATSKIQVKVWLFFVSLPYSPDRCIYILFPYALKVENILKTAYHACDLKIEFFTTLVALCLFKQTSVTSLSKLKCKTNI
jgi:hypothetical protein